MATIVRNFLIPLILSIFVIFNTWYAITYITDPSRVIVVKHRLESVDGNGYLKKYHVINTPETEYKIMVKARTFQEYVMLPKHGESLFSIVLQIFGSGVLLWYFLGTDLHNAFDKQKLSLVRWGTFSLFSAAEVFFYGQLYVKQYWESIYGANDFPKDNFFVEVNFVFLFVTILIFMFVASIIEGFTEKSTLSEEGLNEI